MIYLPSAVVLARVKCKLRCNVRGLPSVLEYERD